MSLIYKFYTLTVKQESVVNDMPCYGMSFVDTATGSFYLTEFQDDADLTKFETFVAQIRPKELILEKVCSVSFSFANNIL